MSDFTWSPSYVFSETPEFNTLISKFENGFEQRRAIRSSPIRVWELLFINVTSDIYEEIRDFFISKKGAYDTFTWTNPNDDTEYTVRFEEDKLKIDRKEINLFDISLQLKEVL